MKSLLCVLIVLVAAPSALAQCCRHCGCESNCRKVCRPIREIKEVPKVTYDCQCEDFCIPGKSCRSTVIDECGHKKHVYTPTCGKVRTRTKLVKNETIEKKVAYKWVVETLCCGCEARCAAAENATVKIDALGMATLIPATVAGGQIAPVGFEQPVKEIQPPTESAHGRTDKPAVAKFGLQRLFAPLRGKPRMDSAAEPDPVAGK